MLWPARLVQLLSLALFAGCSASLTELGQAQTAYDDARFERAKVWLDDLESKVPSLDTQHRLAYWYLRGMSEYRLADRSNALHDLALARELDLSEGGPRLREEQREHLMRALADLTPNGPLEHRPPPAP
jgi:hypothetical protein